MKTPNRNNTLMTLAAALLLAAPCARAADNTGSGGTITYTDSSGLNPVASPPYSGGYVIHTFTSSGTLNIPVPASADVLVVAGGGGGGGNSAGGGGAGGYIYSNSFALAAGSNDQVTVGSGGVGGINAGAAPGGGSNSVFSTITATGGGRGASYGSGVRLAAGSGGSGGGGFWGVTETAGGVANPAGQGNNGGIALSSGSYAAGGGGGASAPGGNGTSTTSGNGGAGISSSISGSAVTYAGGGGGGCSAPSATRGTGGAGGGGNGANAGSAAAAGTANTGGGGGGGGNSGGNVNGAAGGSGIVIVRYPFDSGIYSITLNSPTDGQSFVSTIPVSATTTILSGTAPYEVKFYLDGTLVSTTPSATSPLTVNLGMLTTGSHSIYATVTDNTSTLATSATHTVTVATDTTAPTPDPMTFAINPSSQDLTTVSMTATVATDALSPPVQYYFENTTNSANSGWQSSTVWANSGLTTGQTYGYRVKARDAALNETAFSATANVTTSNDPITWDANGSDAGQTDGTGDWLGANQWWNGDTNVLWNNGMPNNAIIGGGGAGGTITLGAVTAGSVAFGTFTGTYTLTGGSLTNSGGITVGATSGNVRIETPVAGAGGMVKNGSGSTLTLTGQSTYTGVTTVNGGTLNLPTAYGNNTTSLRSAVIDLMPGTSLTCRNTAFGWYANKNAGGLTININGATCQPIEAFGVAYTLTGGTIAGVDRLSLGRSGGFNSSVTTFASPTTSSITTQIMLRNDSGQTSYTFTTAAGTTPSGIDLDISGLITHNNAPDSLVKEGAGTLRLSNTGNNYYGATTVNGGTLAVTGSLGATAVTVNSPATLGGNGNIGGNVTINSGAHHALAVAATTGAQITRAITGTLTMTNSILDLTAAATPAAGEYVLATATTAITGMPATINYNGINGTVSVDAASTPQRLLLTVIGTPYDAWANGTFTNGATLSDKDPAHDPDGDGMTNQQEFAFGLDPTTGASVNPISQQLDKTTGVFKYTRTKDSGLAYIYQSSTTLSNPWDAFTPVTNPPPATSMSATVEEVTVTVPSSLLNESKLFLRVKAE